MGIIEQYFDVMYKASCSECEWRKEVDMKYEHKDKQMRYAIYTHVRETGHKVQLFDNKYTTFERYDIDKES